MGGVLYLLPESSKQVEYSTKARFLYNTDINNSIVSYLDCIGADFLYLSFDRGIIHKNDVLEPYDVKRFEDRKSIKIWSVCIYNMISDYMKINKLKDICILSNSDTYNILEGLLEKDFRVSNPIKCFSKETMVLRWLDKFVMDNIIDRYN